MTTRQQISDLLSYGAIRTKKSFARSTQIYMEKLITLSKVDNLMNRRKAYSIVLKTSKFTRKELIKKLFEEISKKYRTRKGGYTRLLRVTEKVFVVQLL
ncbi:50S ribosomal protein L17 [Plasmodium vivax North Korean]|uniref:50S ribosomal protein L17 n=1 Tax=Plasmodium vivax North Korean TaxID=1035514 RepID=A0A0J9W6S9_PLAVI|nr:50S ribosomal protein L17 [Plasmodium vivax North Korean]